MRLLVFFFGCFYIATAASETNDFSKGPYKFSQIKWKHGFRSWQDHGDLHQFDFTITRPLTSLNVRCPIVYFFSGFEMAASYYIDYAQQLASWGYVVVQYDIPLFPILTDKTLIEVFPIMSTWIESELRTMQFDLQIDYKAIAVAGHSRGGKLATLIALKNDSVQAVYLIDPVDHDKQHAEDETNFPSAVKALKKRNLHMAIAGSSISGSCNPTEFDFHHFWNEASHGSWLTVVGEAGHSQFLSAPALIQWGLDQLCHNGKTKNKDVIARTQPSLVTWFDNIFKMKAPNTESVRNDEKGCERKLGSEWQIPETRVSDAFLQWVHKEIDDGELQFFVKGEKSDGDSSTT